MDRHYVYVHEDPRTGDIRYVGCGTGQRAWMISTTSGNRCYGHRTKEHFDWYMELESFGFLMSDIVRVVVRELSKAEAKKFEKSLIEENKDSLFNIHRGAGSMMNKDKIMEAKDLRADGLTFKKIAAITNTDPMTAWRRCHA